MQERFTVVGIEHRKYKSKQTGENVEGYNLYVTQSSDSKELMGVRCLSFWLKPEVYSDEIELDSEVRLSFNRFGKVSDVYVC